MLTLSFEGMVIGRYPHMAALDADLRYVLRDAERQAETSTTVEIRGESGHTAFRTDYKTDWRSRFTVEISGDSGNGMTSVMHGYQPGEEREAPIGPAFTDPVSRFVMVAALCQRIVDAERLTWPEKYATVFSDAIAGRLRATGLMPDYYDPDMDYDDDVRAFNDAVQEASRRFVIPVPAAATGG